MITTQATFPVVHTTPFPELVVPQGTGFDLRVEPGKTTLFDSQALGINTLNKPGVIAMACTSNIVVGAAVIRETSPKRTLFHMRPVKFA